MDPYDWYAYRLKKAFKGFGTDDKAVCRILGCADKKDALKIAEAWEKKYGKPLREMIKSECSGDYKRLAIAWCTVPDELEAPNEPIELPSEEEEDATELIEDEEEAAEPEPEVPAAEEPTEKDDPEAAPPEGNTIPVAYPVYPSPYYRIPGANLPMGHPVLGGLVWALQQEYLADAGAIVGEWWDGLDKSMLTAAGTSPEAFEAWFLQVEEQVRANPYVINSLRQQWGV